MIVRSIGSAEVHPFSAFRPLLLEAGPSFVGLSPLEVNIEAMDDPQP